jgi:V/A-type H+-transporting ATPase subunit D
MPEREITPTQSAFLELKEERAGMREGYGFLDEKRLILASRILEELNGYETELAGFRAAYAEATEALQAAVARHGLEGLELYPRAPTEGTKLHIESRSVLGVMVQQAACESAEQIPPVTPPNASPAGEQCRDAFRELIPRAARLAVLSGNLERLRLEYTRTARRTRALEEVLLPEIDETLRVVAASLEELEREEAIRVRRIHRIA